MNRPLRIGLSLFALVIGWLMIGFGYMTTLGHPITTILFLQGIGLFFAGMILNCALGKKTVNDVLRKFTTNQ